ncbi:hypothetical protein ACFL2J_05560 [Candidatus Omnitrophota bacterium]
MPPETFGTYIKLRHEIARAEFFGTVPNYLANLAIERTRMETENPTWAMNPSLDTQLAARRNSNKFGRKRGSPHKEM